MEPEEEREESHHSEAKPSDHHSEDEAKEK